MSHQPYNHNIKKSGNQRSNIVKIAVVVVIALAVAVVFIIQNGVFKKDTPDALVSNSSMTAQQPSAQPNTQTAGKLFYMTDKLFVIAEREFYKRGDMTLTIPRLDYTGPVLENVENSTLNSGAGLYEYAQLPGLAPGSMIDNHNISIAAHRDLYGMEFYYIDTITQGDEMYIDYNATRYTYLYESTKIIEPDDWSVIYCTDYPVLTLTSCDPIGIANKRIVVRAKLISVKDI